MKTDMGRWEMEVRLGSDNQVIMADELIRWSIGTSSDGQRPGGEE